MMTDAQWADLVNFEGNANAFRQLTHQFRGRRPGGFAMTYSTLASIVKYPYESRLASKKANSGSLIRKKMPSAALHPIWGFCACPPRTDW